MACFYSHLLINVNKISQYFHLHKVLHVYKNEKQNTNITCIPQNTIAMEHSFLDSRINQGKMTPSIYIIRRRSYHFFKIYYA